MATYTFTTLSADEVMLQKACATWNAAHGTSLTVDEYVQREAAEMLDRIRARVFQGITEDLRAATPQQQAQIIAILEGDRAGNDE